MNVDCAISYRKSEIVTGTIALLLVFLQCFLPFNLILSHLFLSDGSFSIFVQEYGVFKISGWN